jgi:ATP-dependent RNA helicase DeaD
MMKMGFSKLGISARTAETLRQIGIQVPTEVQVSTIPVLLKGSDLVIRSQTGTGKTLAFAIAIVERISSGKANKAIIIAPTRELASQIVNDIKPFANAHGLRYAIVYGGHTYEGQIRALRENPAIVVGTPGRLIDLQKRNVIDFSQYDIVILDEADRMLDMGFQKDMEYVFSNVPQKRQTLMLSATIGRKESNLIERYMNVPDYVEMGEMKKPEQIEEEEIRLKRSEKLGKLLDILRDEHGKVLVFAATRYCVQSVFRKLKDKSVMAGELHGGMSQPARERVITGFKKGNIRVLVATDVAARGLHIDDVTLVINYDIARDAETHLHRVGRTGRMGKAGKAITFVERSLEQMRDKHIARSKGHFGGGRDRNAHGHEGQHKRFDRGLGEAIKRKAPPAEDSNKFKEERGSHKVHNTEYGEGY